ncbi:hypothetical protein tb265_37920 [Gemmatimonadetes bacterium T265]|nr:hypothetical protein tb265_37920 [Gemmatimonadetes bacterium T265]
MTAAHLIDLLNEPRLAEPRGVAAAASLTTDLDLARAVANGFPVSMVSRITTVDPADGGLTPDEVDELIIPRRTLTKRRARRQRLTLEESNRLARVAQVLAAAFEAFGGDPADRVGETSREAARRASVWLRRPHRALDGEIPLALCTTDAGARLVEDALGRVAYGVFA